MNSGAIAAAVRIVVNNSVYFYDTQGRITGTGNVVGGSDPVVQNYCNGARVPPETCASQAGQVTHASCKGYNTPVGASSEAFIRLHITRP